MPAGHADAVEPEEDYPRKIFVNPFGNVADADADADADSSQNDAEADGEHAEQVKLLPAARAPPPGAKPPVARLPGGAKPVPPARKDPASTSTPTPTPVVVAPTSPPPAAKPVAPAAAPPAAVRSPAVSPVVSPAKERAPDGPGRKCDQCNCPAFKKNPFKKGQCAKCFHEHE